VELAHGALEKVWHKSAFKIPLEHCECADPADHLANIDIDHGRLQLGP
jgi:hypothetical protein